MRQPPVSVFTRHTRSSKSSTLPQSIRELLIYWPLVCLCRVHFFPVPPLGLSLELLWRTQHEARLKAPQHLTEPRPQSARLCFLYHMPLQINRAILPKHIHKQSIVGFCRMHLYFLIFLCPWILGIVCLCSCWYSINTGYTSKRKTTFLSYARTSCRSYE